MNDTVFKTLNALRLNKPLFLAKAVSIRTKTGSIVPFVINKGQQYLHNRLEEIKKQREYLRIVIVKGRQMGCSTYLAGRFFHDAIFELGLSVFILTHHSESTQHIFGMVRDFHELLPEPLRLQVPLKASNRKELVFAIQRSAYHIGTAGTGAIGRGTTIQRFHGSEVASFTNTDEISNGVMNAVGEVPGTELILESTANGIGNYFHNMAMSGLREDSKFVTIFLPWYWMPEYTAEPPKDISFTSTEQDIQNTYGLTNGQLYWRRRKIEDDCEGKLWRFQQEYPCVSDDSEVMTERGLIKLKDVIVGDILSQGVVTKVMPKGVKECVRINTKKGYSVILTPEHPVPVESGGCVKASELLGHRVCLSKKVFTKDALNRKIHIHRSVEAHLKIDRDFASVIGYFMGDGSLYSATFSFVFNTRDDDLIKDVEGKLTKYTDSSIQKRRVGKRGIELRFADKMLADIFDKLHLTKIGTGNGLRKRKVHVPEFIWEGPKENAEEFLKSFIATDGFVYKTGAIKMFTKYPDFAGQLQLLFTALGYKTSSRKRIKLSGAKRPYTGYEIDLSVEPGREFLRDIGVLSEWQNKKIRVPNKFTHRDSGFFDEVVSIKTVGARRVIDLTVQGDNCFNANGIVVHNCNLQEAFITSGHLLLNAQRVQSARKNSFKDPMAPIVMGLDPAHERDRTVFVIRQGRSVLAHRVFRGGTVDDPSTAGIAAELIEKYDVDHVFIDVGAGYGVFDTLKNLGYGAKITKIHFGQKAMLPDVYQNKSAEMA
ncbi:MAG: hypothetical protein EOL91_08085, partial [Actinobacteria bacterium]|nr:hypothetical protein [Actinomycetota bacterium]